MGWSFLIIVIFFIHIPVSAFCMEVLHMSELASAIIGGAAGIIAAIITAAITVGYQNSTLNKIVRHLGFGEEEASMKKQLEDKLGSSRKSVADQLGVGVKSISEQLGVDTKSISEQLGVTSKSVTEQLRVGTKSISEQLGVGVDDKSLTKQHEDLRLCISERNSDIASIASIIRNNEERRNNLNTTQQGLLDTLNAFMSDWQSLQSKIAYLETEIAQRDEIIHALRSENEELKTAISGLEEQLDQNSPEE